MKNILNSSKTEYMLGIHDALSAKIAEQAGFTSLWLSSLGVSSINAVRDADELSWTQILDVVDAITDVVNVPVLVDCDTGFGDFNNVRRVVYKMQKHHAGGICIEDKLFPKLNSFIDGQQTLLPKKDFCAKIKAAKDTANSDFCIVARVEALIAGLPMEEAIERALAYAAAGADAILIHSRKDNASEIKKFCHEWHQHVPLVIIPTTYFATPSKEFEKWGVSLVIWANQSLRASVMAMKNIASSIFSQQTVSHIENEILPLKDLFDLVDMAELENARKYYFHEEK